MIVVQDKGIQAKLINQVKEVSQLQGQPTQNEKAALQKIESISLPNIRDEDWRYADLDFLLQAGFDKSSTTDQQEVNTTAIEQIVSEFSNSSVIVIVNGVFSESLSRVSGDNIQITNKLNLKSGLTDQWEHLENPFFYYLNQSNPSSNLKIDLKGVDKEIPLLIIHLDHLSATTDFPIIQPSINITLSANSEASIVEHYLNQNTNPHFRNGVIHINLEENSILNYQKIQNESSRAHCLSNTFIYQATGSQISHGSYQLGSTWSRNCTQVSYSGMNTLTDLYGIAIGNKSQYLDQSIKLNHTQSHADSRQLFKYVLSDKSKGVFNGKILVQENASALNAQQDNHNLLLSESAEMNAKPQLEISNEDVKCSHGSTIGQLDENALFYLRARGIKEKMAKSILTEAFVTQVLENVTNKVTSHYIKTIIQQKLNL
ncbi:MAG: Fe-S cluster assembly protein SufD [Deltaproteobacteria bacterium]|jgi:Fe-S cluster assembly protein SufD|nr:Fe-S cluster assembly protein SufD [Deltaproteobacteria bacterium]MBT4524995.1 Fe-S cluster assembly protein SufD [Deltaproteobacteria bacterium]